MLGRPNHVDSTLQVCDVVTEHGVWDWNQIHELVPSHVAQYIAVMEPPHTDTGPDRLAWRWVTRDGFSTAETYKNLFADSHGDSAILKVIWKLCAPQRARVFFWLLWQDKLLTNGGSACDGT